jgi:regulator of protease activity HflC (stomatin/prohibitin superfamily)
MNFLETLFNFLLGFRFWATIDPDEAGVHLRCGKIRRVLDEGIYFIIPILDTVRIIHTAEQVIDLPNQTLTTKDFTSVNVSGVIVYEVIDPVKASMCVFDYDKSLPTVAIGIVGEEISKTQHMADLSVITETVKNALEREALKWGIDVLSFRFSDNAKVRALRLYN